MSITMLSVFKTLLGEWKNRYSAVIVHGFFMTVIYFATYFVSSSVQLPYFTSTSQNLFFRMIMP